jgi:hypothetical protein
MVDKELYELIAIQDIHDIPMQNGDRRKHPRSLIITLLKTVASSSNMVMEDHGSLKGVISDLDAEPYN